MNTDNNPWIGVVGGALIVILGVAIFIWRRGFAAWALRNQRRTFGSWPRKTASPQWLIVPAIFAVVLGGMGLVVSLEQAFQVAR